MSKKTQKNEVLECQLTNGGIWDVPEEAFLESLPKGITPEIISAVDDARDNFQAAVAGAFMSAIEERGDMSADYATSQYSLGGRMTGAMQANSDSGLVISHTTKHSDALNDIMTRSVEMFDKVGKVVDGADDDIEASEAA